MKLNDKIKIKLMLSRYNFEELTALKSMVDSEYKSRKIQLDKIRNKAR